MAHANRTGNLTADGTPQARPRIDPASWSRPRGRKREFVLGVQLLGAGVITALAPPLAWVMHQSWPASMGQVDRTLLTLPLLLLGVLRAPEFRPFLALVLMSPVIHIVLLREFGLYEQAGLHGSPFAGASRILRAAVLGAAALLIVGALTGANDAVPAGYAGLIYMYIALAALRALDVGLARVAVVGRAPDMNIEAELAAPASGYRYAGFIAIEEGAERGGALGSLGELSRLINEHNLDEVILSVDPGELTQEQRLDLAQTCWRMGAALKMVTPFQPFFRTSARPEMIGDVSVLHVENVGLYATWPQAAKRAMDIAISLATLVVASPLLLLTVLAIKLDSRGPVFFVQRRVGLNGRTFPMIKFRSMRTDNDASQHKAYLQSLIKGGEAHAVDEQGKPVYKIKSDPRVTRVGRFIRKTSIDELPQLVNALLGHMSLVGPRPPIEYEVAEYEDWHLNRLHIRPGLTGLWQVSGRNRLSFEQMVRLDIDYIENWSLWLDLKILLKTIPVLLKSGEGF